MAMIKCNECGRDVSSNAASCPDCGNPIVGAVVKQGTQHVTTEKTKKSLKAAGCLFACLLIVGVFVAIIGVSNESPPTIAIGIVLMFIGIIGYFVNRFQTWWQHG